MLNSKNKKIVKREILYIIFKGQFQYRQAKGNPPPLPPSDRPLVTFSNQCGMAVRKAKNYWFQYNTCTWKCTNGLPTGYRQAKKNTTQKVKLLAFLENVVNVTNKLLCYRFEFLTCRLQFVSFALLTANK